MGLLREVVNIVECILTRFLGPLDFIVYCVVQAAMHREDKNHLKALKLANTYYRLPVGLKLSRRKDVKLCHKHCSRS